MPKITKEQIIDKYYNGVHPTCKCGCGTLLSFKPLKNGPWFAEYTRNHGPKKSHTDETKRKIKESCRQTSIKKFGVENPFQSEEIKKKIKETNLERYGVDNYAKTSEYREQARSFRHNKESIEKIKSTNQRKYGANSFTASNEGKVVLRNKGFINYYGSWEEYTFRLKNNNITILISEEEYNSNSLIPLKFTCDTCGNNWQEHYLLMPTCDVCAKEFERSGRSNLESSLFTWIESLQIPFATNKMFVNPDGKKYSLDVYIEHLNIGIEINGLWWHSEIHGQKDRRYHVDKMNFFNNMGIRVINIFEDEWNNKLKIIKSKILHILNLSNNKKIYGKNTIIKKLSYKEVNEFLNHNHIQGSIKCNVYLGAFYRDELVSVMTFSKNKRLSFNKNNNNTEYELVRFASNIEYNVIGVAGKLLKYFIKNYFPTKIISYADLRFTSPDKNIYSTLNFSLVERTKPNYFYTKGSRRDGRLKFTKHKLVQMGHDPNLTEWEIMKSLKYDKIWDCGHLKYELVI